MLHLLVTEPISIPYITSGLLREIPNTFWPGKTIRKTPAHLFCKAGLFICCKGNKIKITANFHA